MPEPVWNYRCQDVGLSLSTPVHCHAVELQPVWGLHTHDFSEVFLVTRGTAQHRSAAGTEPLYPGVAVAIAPGQVHGFEQVRRLALINILYLADTLRARLGPLAGGQENALFLRDLAPSGQPRGLPLALRLDEEEYRSCLEELTSWLGNASRSAASGSLFPIGCFVKFASVLGAAIARRNLDDPAPVVPPRMAQAIAAIDRAAAGASEFNPKAVAGEAGYSYSLFTREFRRFTGASAMRYFQEHRIQEARRLLCSTDRPLSAIAQDLGFSDAAHFSRFFRRFATVTPSRFRHDQRQGGTNQSG